MRRRAAPALLAVAALLFLAFVALGSWQLQRRAWKLDLIAKVEQRVRAPATEAPGRMQWSQMDPAAEAYRHVRLQGEWLPVKPALVQAVTERGAGFWVLSPLRRDDGSVVMINRGFVAADAQSLQPPLGATTVTGLLRATEPGGGFLRRNDAGNDRWYSRDIDAIATQRGLSGIAPYFVDADAASSRAPGPLGGLTVIAFHNNHLVYAITWYTLALMVAAAAAGLAWPSWRARLLADEHTHAARP
jgi:surfeit locus 1 family protein